MNGVPALRPQYPNYGNVLAQGAAIKGMESRNVLNQMRIQDYPEDRNWLREQRGNVREDRAIAEKQRIVAQDATAFSTALRAKTPEMAMQIFNGMKSKESKGIVNWSLNKEKKELKITYADGSEVSGPAKEIIEATGEVEKNPKLITDSEGVRRMAAWSASKGINFKAAPTEKEAKPDRLYPTEKGLQPREKAIGLMGEDKSPTTAMASFLKGNPNATPDEIAAYAQKLKKPTAPKAGVSYLLKDNSRVTSFDGGRTYRNEAGKDVKMPHDAVKVAATISGQELAMFKAQEQAEAELGKGGGAGAAQAGDMEKVAEGGTGPWAMAAATVDAVLGGLGVDKLFGAKGLFSNTQENRQVLRLIKQLGKAALMISSRGAIYEQKLLDKVFPDPDKAITNPRTEAKKFKALRKLLSQEREFNLRAIIKGTTPKEVGVLRQSNTQIDRLLDMIGTGKIAGGLSKEDKALIEKYAPKQ